MTSLITTAEAASIIGVTQRQIQRLATPDGPLPPTRLRPIILIERSAVEAYIAARTVDTSHLDRPMPGGRTVEL